MTDIFVHPSTIAVGRRLQLGLFLASASVLTVGTALIWASRRNKVNNDEKDRRLIVSAFDAMPLVRLATGYEFVVNTLTEQIPATQPELLRAIARQLTEDVDASRVDVVVVEEDRGAALATAVALLLNKPLAIARMNPSFLPGQVTVPLTMEYWSDVHLTLNGVEKGDRCLLVDDIVSTGGTLIAMLQALQAAGAASITVRLVGAKMDQGEAEGAARVRDDYAASDATAAPLDLAWLVDIDVSDPRGERRSVAKWSRKKDKRKKKKS